MQQLLPIQRRSEVKVGDQARSQQHATEMPVPPVKRRRMLPEWIGLPIALILVLLGWQALVMIRDYEAFVLPGPALVVERLIVAAQSGLLWGHVATTLIEALGGFTLALTVSLVLGYILAHTPWLERALAPVLAASQAIPIIAVAPLIILWFGAGLNSKILIAAVITFFPVLINTIIALRSIPRELREMAIINGASRWQMLRYVEAPLSLPVLFGGIRTGLSLATTGAVVGEFVAGRDGLGALINIARGLFDTPLIFVALMMLAAITLVFYLLVSLLERLLVRWEA